MNFDDGDGLAADKEKLEKIKTKKEQKAK